jgi:tight adherence protein B
MEPTTLIPASLLFLSVAATVVVAALVWDRWQQRRGWRRTVEAVAQVTGKRLKASGPAPASVLKDSAPAGAFDRLPFTHALDGLMEQAAVSWGITGFFTRAVSLGGIFAALLLLLTGSMLVVLPALAAGGALPYLQLRRARARRMARFEEQFPEAVDLLARAIRAGHPFAAGLKMVAEETVDPVAGEFQRVFEEQKFGLSMHESLQGLARRVDLLDVQIFVTAVSIQREVGGNLAEILDQISFTVRERFKIQRQVGVYTAQGRMTGVLLALLPVGLGLLLAVINPGYMGPMFSEPVGQGMLAAATVMQLIGYALIRRITSIEV